MWRLLLLAVALAAPGLAQAQSRFAAQSGIYSFAAPDGWTEEMDDNVDVRFTAPGGVEQGAFFARLVPFSGSLADGITQFIGADALQERRAVAIDGIPCEFASAINAGVMRKSEVLCHFYVPMGESPTPLIFVLFMASPIASADQQLDVFWQVANSIAWGAAFEPAP